jgi:hypothetical protein
MVLAMVPEAPPALKKMAATSWPGADLGERTVDFTAEVDFQGFLPGAGYYVVHHKSCCLG